MPSRLLAAFVALGSACLAADWSPQLAAQYLDQRQEEWFAWKQAQSADGPCVSCHTGLTYLLARPALRRKLRESQPTRYETGLLDRLRTKAGAKPAGALQSVETIFAALFLNQQAEAGKAFEQLWALQSKGTWKWYSADLNPWEHSGSAFFGASLAALAVGTAPAEYRNRPEVQALTEHLQSPETRPLHDRVALLWASSALPAVLTDDARRSLVDEILARQQADGGWTLESLGPWEPHPDAPASPGSNSYATAYVAYVLQRTGTARSNPALARALAWLKLHQDPQSGAWRAESMNKRRPPESMEAKFMQDAATAFAALTLVEAGQ